MIKWNVPRWFPWSQPAKPLYLMPTFTPCFEPLRHQFGVPYFQSILVFEDGLGTWAFRPDDLTALGIRMIDYLLVSANRVDFEQGLMGARSDLLLVQAQVENADVDVMSKDQLAALAGELFSSFSAYYTYGAYVEPIQAAGEALLTPALRVAAKEQHPDSDADSLTRSYFSGGDVEQYTSRMMRERLAIASAFRDARQEVSVIRAIDSADLLASIGKSAPNAAALVSAYCARFHWSKNNYQRCLLLTPTEVVEEVLGAAESFGAAATQLTLQLEDVTNNRKQSASVRASLAPSLSPYLVAVTSVFDTIGVELADERKQTVYRSLSAIHKIVGEIARHTGMDEDLLSYLFPEELSHVLKVGTTRYESRLRQRQQSVLVYQGDFSVLDDVRRTREPGAFASMDGPAIFEGDRLAEKSLKILATRLDATTDAGPAVIVGSISFALHSNDVIVGTARIVRDPFKDQFLPGDILVATSTTPDFVHLMRVAAAIVTDWGGQSSHAALTSRELGIPCITGTAFASTTLRSGTTVSLDFATGVVSEVEESS